MERAIKSVSLVDQAVLKLREYILGKGYKPGDVLPGEIELAEHLGVSRTIIREALSRFRLFGIVDSRRRRGMVLQSPDFLKGMEMALVSAWLGAGTLRELFEFRLMLEIGLADLLFQKKSVKLFKKLARIIEKEDQASTEPERMKADAEFHSALYAATENQTLVRFQDILYPLFKQYASEKVKSLPNPIIDHARLLKELETGSTASFRLAMRHHLEPHFQVQSDEAEEIT